MISEEVKKIIREEKLRVFDIGNVGEDYILYNDSTNTCYVSDGLCINPCPADLELSFMQGVLEGSWIKV